MPTAPIAALSLVLGFAVADVTGVRPLGGVVLVAAVAWCARRWLRTVGAAVTGGLVFTYLLGFALSHVLGHAIGAWPAVLVVALSVGAVVFVAADRQEGGQPAW